MIDALRTSYKLKDLLKVLNIAKSSYCYQKKVIVQPDKYQKLRSKLKKTFENNYNSYGYRRIWFSLRNEGITVSEKIIRRLMKEEGLYVYTKRTRKYSSYKGEISPAVPNVIARNFHFQSPNQKWLTDITEFSIPVGKVYLSPIIDCYDGMPCFMEYLYLAISEIS